MTKRELKELIRSTINEYMGTGASGGNATDGNDMTSQRIGGSFKTDEEFNAARDEFIKGKMSAMKRDMDAGR